MLYQMMFMSEIFHTNLTCKLSFYSTFLSLMANHCTFGFVRFFTSLALIISARITYGKKSMLNETKDHGIYVFSLKTLNFLTIKFIIPTSQSLKKFSWIMTVIKILLINTLKLDLDKYKYFLQTQTTLIIITVT